MKISIDKIPNYPLFITLILMALCLQSNAYSQRIKDLADIAGVRSNQLLGYGLVVGLPGTGEKSRYTEQTFKTMLRNFGINIADNIRPKVKNVAVVSVIAELPAFIKAGQTIDITVSSIGSAKSLRGGTLMQTILKGMDGKAYAVAQGSVVVSGLGADGLDGSKVLMNTPTVGRIANGAMVEREVLSPFMLGDYITFNLRNSDFSNAKRLSDTINDFIAGSAKALDATSVRVTAPRDSADRVSFLAMLENLEFVPDRPSAKVVVNSRTGTIVIGSDVRLLPAAITHGGITVTINEHQSQ